MNGSHFKERGNAFIQQGKYQDALECYTAGLELDPSNHALLSNRSLTLFRLDKLKEALDDADKCIELAPNFGRGHLRRATALNSLGCYSEAKLSTEEGYKLRQSDKVCKECVSQWLVASQALGIMQYCPAFSLILPKSTCVEVLEGIVALRHSVGGVSLELMQSYLTSITNELGEVLSRFNHTVSPCILEWIRSLSLASLIDPRADSIPKPITDSIVQKGTNFSHWLSSEIDPTLYPVVQPIAVLYALVVTNRCSTLDIMNMGHHEREVISKSVLPLYASKGILCNEEYITYHLGTLLGLLGSFHNRRKGLSAADIQEISSISHKMELLVTSLPPSERNIKDTCLNTLATVKGDLRYYSRDKGVHVSCVASDIKQVSKTLLAGRNSSEMVLWARQQMEKLVTTNPLLLTTLQISYVLCGSYALANIGLNKLAVEAFQLAEHYYLKVFTQKMTMGLWSLDEMGSILSSPRSMVLEVAAKLATIDSELFANTIVRWKCLHTEFSAFLMRVGLGAIHQKTYRRVFQPHNPIDQHTILQVASEHKRDENALVKLHGPVVLAMLFKQSYQLIQRVLEKDEVVLDYCYLGAIYSEEGLASELSCGIVLIKPEGKPVTEIFDYNKAGYLGKQWHHLLTTGSLSAISAEAEKISRQLCNLLFPSSVREIIESDQVKRVFFCPDLQISNLPLDLLIFPDNQMLLDKCAVIVLSSSREVLRYGFIPYLETNQFGQGKEESESRFEPKVSDFGQHGTFSQKKAERNVESNTTETDTPGSIKPLADSPEISPACNSEAFYTENSGNSEKCQTKPNHKPQEKEDQVTVTKSNHCIIFANPNFDLETEQAGIGALVDVVKNLLSAVFHIPATKGPVEPLPATEEEARSVEYLLSTNGFLPLPVQVVMGSSATMKAVLDVNSPFILHFATHGFAANSEEFNQEPFGGNFWVSTSSGLLLAGANTYSSGKYNQILNDASTGLLASLAVCGMNLKNTHLVYLSACSSCVGRTTTGESTLSLSEAFRAAGAHSVIATRWPVEDSASKVFSTYFYSALCSKRGVHPSEALVSAKQSMRRDQQFSWLHWATYVCIGCDFPLFPNHTE